MRLTTATRLFLPAILALGSITASQAATITIFATAARNVSDRNLDSMGMPIVPDGIGDEVGLLNYPWLSAGIFLSGASGQNGTARFQMEFDLSGITAQISSAFLVLNSDPDDNNILETTFFHVTGDEDGVITTTDFQSPAVSTGIAVPVSFPGQVYNLNVTPFVVADKSAGFLFTSFQGRASDENAAMSFRLGMEFLSSAPVNGEFGPRLIVNTVPEPSALLLTAGALGLLLAVRKSFC